MQSDITEINYQHHPTLDHLVHTINMKISPMGQSLCLTLKYYSYFNVPYTKKATLNSSYHNATPVNFRSNVWILSIVDNNLVTLCRFIEDLYRH